MSQLVSSVGANSNVQVKLSMSASGPGSAQIQGILNKLTVEIHLSSPSGGTLASSKGNQNSAILLKVNGKTFLELRQVDSNFYVKASVAGLASFPGVNLTPAQIASLQLTIDGQWFELPQSLLDSLLPKTHASASKTAADQAAGVKVLDAFTKVINSAHYQSLGDGSYSESGTIQSLAQSVYPALQQISHSVKAPKNISGTYLLIVRRSGSTATGGSLSITVHNHSGAGRTLKLKVSIAHANDPVTAPSGAKVINQQLLDELRSSAS